MVDGSEGDVVALVLRGDHELNAVKAQKLPGVASPLRMASADAGARGDRQRARLDRAHRPHRQGLRRSCRRAACRFRLRRQRERHALHRRELGPRLPGARARSDMRNVLPGDPSPARRGHARNRARHRGRPHFPARAAVQRGHARHGARRGRASRVTMFMGCYGIGVTRVVAAAIEQNHDANGIIWPEPHRAVQRRAGADQLPEVRAGTHRGRSALRGIRRGRHRCAARRPRRAPGSEVRGCRAHRHSAPHRHRRSRRWRGQARISSPPRDRIHGNSRRGCGSLYSRISSDP